MQLNVNARYIRSLRHIMASNDVRYYLCGVQVLADERGKVYTATDGKKLAVYFEPWADNEDRVSVELIIPGDVVKAIKPHKRIDHAMLATADDGKHWTLTAAIALTFEPVDGKFPDYARVIPTKVSGEHADFDFSLLDDFNSCTKEGLDARYSCKLYTNGAGAAAVRSAASPHFLGVVMPLRSDCEPDYAAPAWLERPMPEEQRKAA